MFKSLTVVLLSVIFATIANAQTEKGRLGIYGSLSAATTTANGISGTNFSVAMSPAVLYFVADNLAISPGIGAMYSGWSNGHSVSASIGGGVDYYFGSSDFKPFVGVNVSYRTSKYVQAGVSSPSDDGLGYGGVIGLDYFFTNSTAIATTVNYARYTTYHSAYSNATNSSLSMGVGITYILPK